MADRRGTSFGWSTRRSSPSRPEGSVAGVRSLRSPVSDRPVGSPDPGVSRPVVPRRERFAARLLGVPRGGCESRPRALAVVGGEDAPRGGDERRFGAAGAGSDPESGRRLRPTPLLTGSWRGGFGPCLRNRCSGLHGRRWPVRRSGREGRRSTPRPPRRPAPSPGTRFRTLVPSAVRGSCRRLFGLPLGYWRRLARAQEQARRRVSRPSGAGSPSSFTGGETMSVVAPDSR